MLKSKKEREINVLGTTYYIRRGVSTTDDVRLLKCHGYTDFTTKNIVVSAFGDEFPMGVGDIESYEKKVVRHEIVHAMLTESGLLSYSDDETIVDWVALQYPKLKEIFKKLEVE